MTLQIIEMQEHLYGCYYAVFLYSGRPRKLQVGDLYTVQLLIRIHNLYIFSMKSEEKNRNAMARETKWRNNEIINFKINHLTKLQAKQEIGGLNWKSQKQTQDTLL